MDVASLMNVQSLRRSSSMDWMISILISRERIVHCACTNRVQIRNIEQTEKIKDISIKKIISNYQNENEGQLNSKEPYLNANPAIVNGVSFNFNVNTLKIDAQEDKDQGGCSIIETTEPNSVVWIQIRE